MVRRFPDTPNQLNPNQLTSNAKEHLMDPETAIAVATASSRGFAFLGAGLAAVGAATGYKAIGAGLACLGMAGAAVGLGNMFSNYLSGALRNPSAAGGQVATMFIGIAFSEALGIFSFLVALLLMFAV